MKHIQTNLLHAHASRALKVALIACIATHTMHARWLDFAPSVNPDILQLPAPSITKAPVKAPMAQKNIGLLMTAVGNVQSLARTHQKKFIAGVLCAAAGLGYLLKRVYKKLIV